ncbi:uncharacterized protein BO97DRAFT_422819 [Aspergillus homomorphus CBS 101889]|uniref:Uncharacterized protein n=1 Tax=Aspergillus homomorphus (strain CBS 101889) TaxID=1450537 RepID=A0A395I478_ASPHC|nr:hypothetical protein BO97DRAFT_422819 [Aspergillus homomorphus CBS 101889]RAL14403.1 hypothetical protein BO97DRAFT_422819 [Aspergillus homomorphus CBS 101889]
MDKCRDWDHRANSLLKEGQIATIGLLLGHGAEIGCTGSNGFSPLTRAVAYADHASLTLVNLLLDQCGTDPLQGAKAGWSALQVALFRGLPGCVQKLLANVSMQNSQHWKLMHRLTTYRRPWFETPRRILETQQANRYWRSLCQGTCDGLEDSRVNAYSDYYEDGFIDRRAEVYEYGSRSSI